MTVTNIHKLAAVPLHPGTQRYLKDPSAACNEADAVLISEAGQ
jgi:hypothetical protein